MELYAVINELNDIGLYVDTYEPMIVGCMQGSKNPLVRSYLQVPQAAGQVKLWMISNVN